MTTAERIDKTLQQLPVSIQEEVLDFAEFLFERLTKARMVEPLGQVFRKPNP